MAAPPPQQPDVFDPTSLLLPSPGSRLSHRELHANGEAREPTPENPMPQPHAAFSEGDPRLNRFRVLPPEGVPLAELPRITLVRAEGAERAYAKLSNKFKAPISLHHHPEWGYIFFAVIYYRVKDTNDFRAPLKGYERFAAIKKLKRAVVDKKLREGGEGEENPYKEFARGAEIGDNIHVLKPYEFLVAPSKGEGEDEEYLYICSPMACKLEGTLQDFLTRSQVIDRDRAHKIFCKVLQILLYLESKKINHHDMSPDNFLFLPPNNNLVVFDLAMSLRIPENTTTGQRTLIKGRSAFGTPPYMPHEVWTAQDFDGVGMDLYSAGVILYKLFTNRELFDNPADRFFDFFVSQGGLWNAQINAQMLEDRIRGIYVIRQLDEQEKHKRLVDMAASHLRIDPDAMSLLKHLLAMDPLARYSLYQAIKSEYVQRRVHRRTQRR